MIVTLFPTMSGKTFRRLDMTLEELRDLIFRTTAVEKTKLPWLKLARFGRLKTEKGSLRHDANVESVSGIEGDYDEKIIQFDEVVRILRVAKITALVYTSPSYVVAAPKWRVLCPTSCELEPEERKKLVSRLDGLLGGILARESYTLSQAYFYGSVNSNPTHRVEIIEGDFIDLRPELHQLSYSPDNPFLKAAEEQNFKLPIDVEKSLAEMKKGSIHNTQLSVSASLLSVGIDTEGVVTRVLAATREAGEPSWDWQREEKVIRGMCDDWVRKHPKAEIRTSQQAKPEVVNLAEKRAERVGVPKKGKAHVALAEGILKKLAAQGEQIILTAEQVWRCRRGVWSILPPGEVKNWLDWETQEGCRNLGLVSTQKLRSETRSYLMNEIFSEGIQWDSHGKIPIQSGLLDPKTLSIEALLPEHRATYLVDCKYDPVAECPWWLRVLDDCFADQGTRNLLQELSGVSLLESKPRSLMRALVLVGASNTGKSSILNILAGLISNDANTTTFDTLENAHGLTQFLQRRPWLLHEAFDQSKWHFSSTVKALLSGDHVNVNIKNGPILTHRFKSPVFWGTNHPPQFKEASEAMVNRMIIVTCKRVFDEITGAAVEAHNRGYSGVSEMILADEKPGLLNWALVGMQRAVIRGKFQVTDQVKASLHELRRDSNLVAGFLEECTDYDPLSMVSVPDFCAAFALWWSANKGEDRRVPSNDSVGRAIGALADEYILKKKIGSRRYYEGIILNETGIDYWRGAAGSNLAAGKTAHISNGEGDVNRHAVREAPIGTH